LVSVLVVTCSLIGATARADSLTRSDTPKVLIIGAPAKPGSAEAEVTEAVRAALAELSEVELLPPSPLDLEAVQLAIDCTDESSQCLGEIATRMNAEILIIPSLKVRAESLELRLRCFKQSPRREVTTAMRKQAGTQLDSTLLDAVPGMLREALALGSSEAEPVEDSAPDPLASRNAERTGEEPHADEESGDTGLGLPLGPILLGGGGLSLIAAGLVVGAMANASENDYASRTIDTVEQAKRADAVRERGESEALAANVLLGTGTAALVAAGVWYLLDRETESAPAHASLRPVLGPQSAGLLLSGHWQWEP
jgi:hypothetical protein